MNINNDQNQTTENPSQKAKSLSLIQTIKSVLWAMLGIQTKENLMRDFAHGKASNFIITGLIFVTLFVLFLIITVKVVLSLAL